MTQDLEVKKGTNKFYIGGTDENSQAQITYVKAGDDKIIVDHTLVPDEMGGMGVGKLLLQALADWAREEDLQVMATCSYAVYQMEKDPAYHDIYLK